MFDQIGNGADRRAINDLLMETCAEVRRHPRPSPGELAGPLGGRVNRARPLAGAQSTARILQRPGRHAAPSLTACPSPSCDFTRPARACHSVRSPPLRATQHRRDARGTASRGAHRPTLIVFITVDQMRADYFQRFDSQLTGGLRRLFDSSAFFLDGYQDHAITETAPGHSVTMSGRFPVHTGITMNSTA